MTSTPWKRGDVAISPKQLVSFVVVSDDSGTHLVRFIRGNAMNEFWSLYSGLTLEYLLQNGWSVLHL